MSDDLGRMIVRLEADVKKFNIELDRAEKQNRDTTQKMKQQWAGFATQIKGVAGGIAGALSLRELTRQMQASLDFASGIVDKADRLGVAVEAYQELEVAAGQAGVSSDTFERSMAKLALTTVKAAKDGTRASALFKELGVSALDAEGNIRSVDDVIGDLADAIVAVPDPNLQLAITKELVGEKGRAFLGFLKQGKEGIDDARKAAVELGAVLPEEIARKGEEAGDKLEGLARVVKVQLSAALIELTPLAIAAGNELAGLAKMAGDAFTQISRFRGEVGSIDRDLISLSATISDLRTAGVAESTIAPLDAKLRALSAQREAAMARADRGALAGSLGFDEFGSPIAPPRSADTSGLRNLLGGGSGGGGGGRSSGPRPIDLGPVREKAGDAVLQINKELEQAAKDHKRLQEQITRDLMQATGDRIGLIKLEGAEQLAQVDALEKELGRTQELQDDRAKITAITNAKIEAEQQRHSDTMVSLLDPFFGTAKELLGNLATGAEFNFDEIKRSFAQMVIEMTLEAAKAQLLKKLTDGGGGGGGASGAASGGLGIIATIGKFFGGMADGGLAMRPTITAFAEKEPEFAVPWSKVGPFIEAAGGGGGSGDLTVINQVPGVHASARKERGPDGRTVARVWLENEFNRAAGGGAFRDTVPGMRDRGVLR